MNSINAIMIGFFFVGIFLKLGELVGGVITAIIAGAFKAVVRIIKEKKR